jgi:flagellar protein FliO/FliZ
VNRLQSIFVSVGLTAASALWIDPALAAPAAEPMAATNLLQLLFGLIVVLIAIGVTAFLLRRLGRLPQGAGALRVVAGLNLGARERAVLIQVGDKQILLGVAPGRVETLHVLERPVDSGVTPSGPAGGFAERLAQLMKGGRP